MKNMNAILLIAVGVLGYSLVKTGTGFEGLLPSTFARSMDPVPVVTQPKYIPPTRDPHTQKSTPDQKGPIVIGRYGGKTFTTATTTGRFSRSRFRTSGNVTVDTHKKQTLTKKEAVRRKSLFGGGL